MRKEVYNINVNKAWIDDVWNKIECKMNVVVLRSADKIPYTTIKGVHDDKSKNNMSWWTNGFWPGILWLMYVGTGNEFYKTTAEKSEEKLDEVLYGFDRLDHDTGFLWLLSSVTNYRITENAASRRRGLLAASTLAGRFNTEGRFIRAWNDRSEGDSRGWAIIDSMMNLPLLYWATLELNDPRFKHIAMKHANTVMKTFIREDGSVKHIVEFNPDTGEYIKSYAGQGYGDDSSWTRGQAWALYGFILSYIHTNKQEYLNTAKKIAHYFIANLQDDPIPPCDFRSPKEPRYKDTTAGVCAACGLIEIAKTVSEFEKDLYVNTAIKILKSTEELCYNWSDREDSIVQMGTEAYHSAAKNIPIIYGDYFFIEAILKLRGENLLFW